jgi:protein SCO1/2
MSERIWLALVIFLTTLLVGLALFWSPALPEAALPKPALAPGGDFTLQSADGTLSLKDYRGKLVLVYFGYTYCPDICPTSLAATAAALNLLTPEEAAQVAVIFISVDPQRDTPARLKEYAAFFHPVMIGVTGTPDNLAEIAGRYGAFYAHQKVDSAGGYVVDHTADTYVVGRSGRLLTKIPHGAAADWVAREIRQGLQ